MTWADEVVSLLDSEVAQLARNDKLTLLMRLRRLALATGLERASDTQLLSAGALLQARSFSVPVSSSATVGLGRAFIPHVHRVVAFQSKEFTMQYDSVSSSLHVSLLVDWPAATVFDETTCHSTMAGSQALLYLGIVMPPERHRATCSFSPPSDTSQAKLAFLQKKRLLPPFLIDPLRLSRKLLEYFFVLAMPDEEFSPYATKGTLTASTVKRALDGLEASFKRLQEGEETSHAQDGEMIHHLDKVLPKPVQMALRFRRNEKQNREKTIALIRLQLKVEFARYVPIKSGPEGGLNRITMVHEGWMIAAVEAMAVGDHAVAVQHLKAFTDDADPRSTGFFSLLYSKALNETGSSAIDVSYWRDRAHNLDFAEAAWFGHTEGMLMWLLQDKNAAAILAGVGGLRSRLLLGETLSDLNSKGILELMALPPPATYILAVLKILLVDYGFAKSVDESRPVDGSGKAIPLYTYPTIQFLEQISFESRTIFEYGSGMSTIWWGERAKHVVAVENDKGWHKEVNERHLKSASGRQNMEVLLLI